jgi:hypothetical protein
MGRGEAPHECKLRNNLLNLLAKYHLLLWCPLTHHNRQCQVIHQYNVHGFLPTDRNKGHIRIDISAQTNGVVERANTLIFQAIKKILEGKKKGKWAEVMPQAIWSHNTTVCRRGETSKFKNHDRASRVPNRSRRKRPAGIR